MASQPIIDPGTGEVLVEANQWITREMAAYIGKLQVTLPVGSKSEEDRLIGTKSVAEIPDPKTGQVLVKQDELLTPHLLDLLRSAGVKEVKVRPRIVIRSPMTCETKGGVCQLCYGYDMSNHKPVQLGTAVGVIAAQSVGEPGTQLTMRTFHTGGVAGEDITQGLPRAEELFEARKTMKSGQAGISPLDGHVTAIIPTQAGKDQIEITSEARTLLLPTALCKAEPGEEIGSVEELLDAGSPCAGEVYLLQTDDERRELFVIDTASGDRSYPLPPNAVPCVKDGDRVKEGDPLTERFNIEPIVAEKDGTVRIPEDKSRTFELVTDDGEKFTYEIPYGARMIVEPGAKVREGDALTSRSKPIFIAAEGEGTVLIIPGRIIVYNPEGRAIRFPLTPDVSPNKGNGEKVREGEPLVRLEVEHAGSAVVDQVEKEGEITRVSLRYKSIVETDQAVTVHIGDKVKKGDLLTKGVIAPHTLLDSAGVNKTREYLLTEIHKVYKAQGVDINDKHLEVIIRQILNNVRIVERGDSRFLLGDLVPLEEFQDEVSRLSQWNSWAKQMQKEAIGAEIVEDVASKGHLIAQAGTPLTPEILHAANRAGVETIRVRQGDETAEIPVLEKQLPLGERELLRISKAALQTKGWLSAASFQRTTKVLAEAALRGETDELEGLKPSIIVGKRIPAGTGFPMPEKAQQAVQTAEAEPEASLTESSD